MIIMNIENIQLKHIHITNIKHQIYKYQTNGNKHTQYKH